jgi:hypothetical protein
LAGYVEAMTRASAGQRKTAAVWRYLRDGIRRGAPSLGDPGLDGSSSWECVYWASMAFFLRADMAMRARGPDAPGLPASRPYLPSGDQKVAQSTSRVLRTRCWQALIRRLVNRCLCRFTLRWVFLGSIASRSISGRHLDWLIPVAVLVTRGKPAVCTVGCCPSRISDVQNKLACPD